MSEKTKWFKPVDKFEDLPLTVIDCKVEMTLARATDYFLREIETLVKQRKLHLASYKSLNDLAIMKPVGRLNRNLTRLLNLLSHNDCDDNLKGLLGDQEYQLLVDLELAGATATAKETAQELMNIRERRQLLNVVRNLYAEERRRKWRLAGE